MGAGSDTNYALFGSMLRQAGAAGGREGYDFVLVTCAQTEMLPDGFAACMGPGAVGETARPSPR